METTTPAYFNPIPNQAYKIVSVLDGRKAFTLQNGTNNLILSDYTGTPNQNFHVFNNTLKYAFVSLAQSIALHIQKDNPNDGGVPQGDAGQHPSSFFEIVPVTKGEWASKACYIKTFAGKALDIKGGQIVPNVDICAWSFHGGNNQTWVIAPADQGQTQPIQPVNPVQPVQPVQPAQQLPAEVPSLFVATPNTLYRVVSAQNPTKALTIDKVTNKLSVSTFNK